MVHAARIENCGACSGDRVQYAPPNLVVYTVYWNGHDERNWNGGTE